MRRLSGGTMASNYRNRIKELERTHAPSVLAGIRFITDMPVEADDPRSGDVIEIVHPCSPVPELYVYTTNRGQFQLIKSGLEDKFILLDC